MVDRIMLIGLFAAIFVFAGCCGAFEEGSECVGETVITINGETTVCYDGVMSGSCADDGEIYKQDEDEMIVCRGGEWMREDVSIVQPDTQSGMAADTSTEASTGSEDDESCTGTGFFTVGSETSACVNGKWTTDCSNEGEVYDESDFLEVRIVCESGKWTSKPL